jgi:hypothetical protein
MRLPISIGDLGLKNSVISGHGRRLESKLKLRRRTDMRIWHKQLISKLCSKHLGAVWYEGLSLYSIITKNTRGWKNTPMRMEFEACPEALHDRLRVIREERLKRGYKAKELPERIVGGGLVKPWQSLEKQAEILGGKCKKCRV